MQKVVLARNLMTVCGSRPFQWYLLRLACLLFMRRPELASLLKSCVDINIDFATMCKANRLVREHPDLMGGDLWDILNECSCLATSEPRDKIYAIFGLARKDNESPEARLRKTTPRGVP